MALDGGGADFVDEGPEFGRAAVDELGAELDGAVGRPVGPHAAAQPIARLEHEHAPARRGKVARDREPRHACADDDHVRCSHELPGRLSRLVKS